MKKIEIVIIILFVSLITNAQLSYKAEEKESKIEVSGTSTLHDWTMIVDEFLTNIDSSNATDFKIGQIVFSCKTEDIKSDNSIMDSKTHKALKSSKHPFITFSSTEIQLIKKAEGIFKVNAKGKLTIAGVSRQLNLNGDVKIKEGYIHTSFSHKFKMSDFNVDPPTAVMGTIKTGDEIEIKGELIYKQ